VRAVRLGKDERLDMNLWHFYVNFWNGNLAVLWSARTNMTRITVAHAWLVIHRTDHTYGPDTVTDARIHGVTTSTRTTMEAR
jgi:hypothetical protein